MNTDIDWPSITLPQFIKVGSLVRYRPEDLEFWLAALPTGADGRATVIESLRDQLKGNETNSRRRIGPQVAVESCALVVLALRNHCSPEYPQALYTLLASRNGDGSWPAFTGDDPNGSWATAVAVLALVIAGRPLIEWERGLTWLLYAKGREANWFWRWKFQTIDNNVRFDPRKYGWSWVPGTASWVIPTSFSLFALQRVRAVGLSHEPRLSERITVGIAMLLDRICPGGGWNAGNGIAFGVALAPYIDATAIALLALQQHKHEAVIASLTWLIGRLPDCPSPYSLAWGILALTAYHKETERSDTLVCALNALLAAIEKDRRALDTATLAICVLALEAMDSDNVFAVRA